MKSLGINPLTKVLAPVLLLAAIALLIEAALSGSGAGAVAASSSPAEVSCDSTGSTVPVRLRGSTGEERATLAVSSLAGEQSAMLRVGTDFAVETLTFVGYVDASDVRIDFTNDLYIDDNNDRNLTVDWIEVCGERFQTDASTTESLGIFDFAAAPGTGCKQLQYGAGETLHCNGYFQYAADASMPSTVQVTVTAAGTSGEEILDVTDGRSPITSFALTQNLEDYTFEVPRGTSPSDLFFEFNNDKYVRGVVDRNMIVEKLVFDGRTLRTLEPRTHIQGFFKYGQCLFGNNNEYLHTEIIHCNGWFNFERGAPSQGR